MFDYSQLETLYFVGREASFNLAAQKLRISQSAVSQRIKALEDAAGHPLVVRSSPPRLTALGVRFAGVFEQMRALTLELRQKQQGGDPVTISLACNHESFEIWFNSCMVSVAKDLGVLLNIKLDDQDRTIQHLKNAEVLGCVSSEAKPPQGCSSIRLGKMMYRCVAHRDLAAKHPLTRQSRKKLLTIPTVVFGPFDRLHDEFLAQVIGEESPPPYSAHVIPSIRGMLDHVLNGSAYAVLPDALTSEYLKAGELVNLFKGQTRTVSLYWHVVGTSIPILEQISERIAHAAGAALL